jgi:hypothetical protein
MTFDPHDRYRVEGGTRHLIVLGQRGLAEFLAEGVREGDDLSVMSTTDALRLSVSWFETVSPGLPDAVVVWSLERVNQKAKPAASWRCDAPGCGCLNEIADTECVDCGIERPGGKSDSHPREITTAAGELAQLTPEQVAQLKSINYYTYLGKTRTEAELRTFARVRGYQISWVRHRLREEREAASGGRSA